MISFDLRCGADHVFEAWFRSGADYDEQAAAGRVACPLCGDRDVRKAAMAPNVAAKANRGAGVPARAAADPGAPAAVKEVLRAVAAAQAEALKSSRWVGDRFAERARAMHDGDEPSAPIHGRATPAEARSLAEDGVAVAPLLVPAVPPERLN